MSTWKLAPQERSPVEGSFTAIDELLVTAGALALFGDAEIQQAIAVLATAAIVTKLEHFQVLERGDDGQVLYAADEDGRVTLMLPEDW